MDTSVNQSEEEYVSCYIKTWKENQECKTNLNLVERYLSNLCISFKYSLGSSQLCCYVSTCELQLAEIKEKLNMSVDENIYLYSFHVSVLLKLSILV